MLREVLRYELGLQARRVTPWLSFALLLAMTYQVATEAQIEQARDGGYLFNGPYALGVVSVLSSILGLLVSAPLAGDAAARDVQLLMHPLVYTTPVGRTAYLGGRFLAAFALSALVQLAVPLALLLAAHVPGPEPALLGPPRPAAYLGIYLAVTLPNAFVASALMFCLAVVSRRAMSAYFGAVLLFATTLTAYAYVAHKLRHWAVGKLVDPLGFTVLRELSTAWTPGEKSTQLLALVLELLPNRLLWVGLALGALALTHRRFRFAHPGVDAGRRTARGPAREEPGRSGPITVPPVRPTFGAAARVRQVGAVAGQSLRALLAGPGGVALVLMPLFLLLVAPEVLQHMGVPLRPSTKLLTAFISGRGDLLGMGGPLLVIFCAGSLVWREREAGLSELADAAPVPDWVSFVGKLAGLTLLLVLVQAALTATSLLIQVRLDHADFQPGLYLRVLFGLKLADHLLFALLALGVHVLVDQKYVGHLVLLLVLGLQLFAPALGLEDPLLVYGADPGWEYNDLNGFGPHLVGWAWFKAYWAGWALLLAVAARLLWVRGRVSGPRERLRLARHRLTRPLALTGALAGASVLGVGGYVAYNTHVLNPFRTDAEVEAARAEYERRYGQYARLAQPQLTHVRLHVELHPRHRRAELRGTYALVNHSAETIPAIHVVTSKDVETVGLRFDRPATPERVDAQLRHAVYALREPLRPGESLQLDFEVRFAPRGFSHRKADPAVAENGTYLVPRHLLPSIGYQAGRELNTEGARREHGLPPRPAIPPLDTAAERRDEGEPRIAMDVVVVTDEGQTALAPGALRRTWSEGGRRSFHYVTDVPIDHDYALYSAAYAVREARWRDVAIEVVHHPGHPGNVESIVRSVQASLDFHTEQFGPYPHRQLRFVEHAGHDLGLHAAPVNVSYLEGFSDLRPEADPRDVDFPFAVAAHEVAHQWWGNQLTPARVEGAPLLTESLAWYSALAVVERTHGRAHLERLLALMRLEYLTPRSRAGVPLLRAADWFQGYRKGPFAMYALREHVGEARLHAALRALLRKYGAGTPPLPTSLDLYRELQAVTPREHHGLLHDLFAANTYWELKTKRATVEPAEGGQWRVSLDVVARKVVVDEVGHATEVPMDEAVEVGVYGGEGATEPLHLGRHRVRSGEQRLTVTVPQRPARAGIDPRHLLIDVNPEDNTEELSLSL
jgi:hypothetical protein